MNARLQLTLTDEEAIDTLKRLADEEGRSYASVIVRALAEYRRAQERRSRGGLARAGTLKGETASN